MMDKAQWVYHFTINYPNLRYAHAELRSDFDRLWIRTDWKDYSGALNVFYEHLHALPWANA